jgi:hypothetical protein
VPAATADGWVGPLNKPKAFLYLYQDYLACPAVYCCG